MISFLCCMALHCIALCYTVEHEEWMTEVLVSQIVMLLIQHNAMTAFTALQAGSAGVTVLQGH